MTDADGTLGIGIVGASPGRSWAGMAHVPALARVPGVRLTAVATTRRESAEAAAAAFGVQHTFDDFTDLVACNDVDLVTVSVKVPAHAEVVRSALAHGKHVYCEWPLGRDLDEAVELADLAAASQRVHVIGLQGRLSASTQFVRDLVNDETIGDVESVSATVYAGMNGSHIPESLRWAADPRAGVNNLTVSGGHVLATLASMFSGPASVSAVLHNRLERIEVGDAGDTVLGPPPNQVVVAGVTPDGVTMTVVIQGGNPPVAAGFAMTVMGTNGCLFVRPANGVSSMWIGEWTVELRGADGVTRQLDVPARSHGLAGPAANVADVYNEAVSAITSGRAADPNFGTAVHYHQVLAAIEKAASTGERQRVAADPATAPKVNC